MASFVLIFAKSKKINQKNTFGCTHTKKYFRSVRYYKLIEIIASSNKSFV